MKSSVLSFAVLAASMSHAAASPRGHRLAAVVVATSTTAGSPLATANSTAASSAAASSASGSMPPSADTTVYNGDGTWYGDNCGEEACWNGGACQFVNYTLPATIDGSTCVSEAIWNSSANCGGCVAITYQGKKKIAMITNKTGGDAVHLDMSPDMFSQLADKSRGEINMQWEYVPCPISSPLQILIHGGASQYWFAATVENAVYRTTKLEVSADKGQTWKSTTRNINNFFTLVGNGGTGTPTAWVRVTSELGSQVVVQDVKLSSGALTIATENFH